jgi:uncharacterized protein YndB with AHSA1/START domain
MNNNLALPENFTLHIHQELQIDAPIAVVFETILDQGNVMVGQDGKSMNLKLEAWPGGRWFRDLGNNAGHLWGHVQVIKPPTLLEITGPMMMSYAALNHIQYRLSEKSGITTLALTHRAIGELDPQHREGVGKGWKMILEQIKANAQR